MHVLLYAPGATWAPRRLAVGEDDVDLVDDGPARVVAGPGRPRLLTPVDVGTAAVDTLLSPATPSRATPLVYADRFARRDLLDLLERGWCGLDRTGQAVVVAGGLTLLVAREAAAGSGTEVEADRLPRLRGRVAGGEQAGVRGAVTARLTQQLLEAPGAAWRPTDLAAADSRTTVATASRLLAELNGLGLCSRAADGAARWHTVLNPGLLLRWLADRPPVTARPVLDGYLRVRDPAALVTTIGRRVRDAGLPAVLTGAAAAGLEAPVTTAARPTVRVAPDVGLDEAADALGLDTAGHGHNVRLLRDVGLVGTLHPRVVRDVPVAGPVRTWLDLRAERRGADAAELYRDLVLGPVLGIGP